jgi:hypothetical protein
MRSHHSHTALSVALVVIGLIILPVASTMLVRVVRRTPGSSFGRRMGVLSKNNGRTWTGWLFGALVGVILIVKGISGL